MEDVDLIVDFHSHILPGVDHGSDSIETSLFQLKCAKKRGISKIVSTSHFYPTAHNVDIFLKKRDEAYFAILGRGEDIPEIRLAAEVLLCNGIDRLPGLEKLCLHGTRNMLLELPLSEYHRDYGDTIERLLVGGYNVILAHPDRYPQRVIKNLLPLGVKLQLNADSVLGLKKLKNKHLFEWVKEGHVVALGSDIHGKNPISYSRLRKAFCVLSRLSDAVSDESNRMFLESTKIQCEKHKV